MQKFWYIGVKKLFRELFEKLFRKTAIKSEN